MRVINIARVCPARDSGDGRGLGMMRATFFAFEAPIRSKVDRKPQRLCGHSLAVSDAAASAANDETMARSPLLPPPLFSVASKIGGFFLLLFFGQSCNRSPTVATE